MRSATTATASMLVMAALVADTVDLPWLRASTAPTPRLAGGLGVETAVSTRCTIAARFMTRSERKKPDGEPQGKMVNRVVIPPLTTLTLYPSVIYSSVVKGVNHF